MRLIDRILIFGVLLWVAGLLAERVATELAQPPEPVVDVALETLPRGLPDPDDLPELARGRVVELPVQHPRRGAHHVGSAWQVGDGTWMSVRHVVDGCDMRRLGTVSLPQLHRVWRHPDADLAAFESEDGRQSVALAERPPRAGDGGYAVGYPRGQAGVAEITLIGAARMRLTGAVESERPFRYLLWRIDRLPGHVSDAGELGGISGGAVLDRDGRAIGVAFSSMPRRALLGTISYADTRRAIDTTGAGSPSAAFDAGNPLNGRAHAARLLQEGGVSLVVCRS